MEKSKEMLLIEKLRRASHSAHGGKHGGMRGPAPCGPGMPPHGPGPHRGPGCRPGGPGMFPRERILSVVLEAGDEGLRQKDIADRLGIHAPALTEQLDRLEAERYLERIANPDDRRSTLVKLTEKGRARAYEVADERQTRAAAFCAALSEEEKDTLIALLDKLIAGGDA